MYKLSLAHLYPKLLNLHGDIGNVYALQKRCEWRNIALTVENIDIGDKFNPDKFDICFIGGGQDLQQIIVSQELIKQKNAFFEAMQQNMVMLAIDSGYQIFGETFQTHDKKEHEGIDLLDIYTVASDKRFTGNVTLKSEFLTPQKIVGFENHNGLTYLKEGTKAFATTIIGKGNNGEDNTEGAKKKNVFGTYVHGALLPKNPHFADYLIELALEKKYGEKIKLKPLNDEIETNTYKSLIGKKY